MYHCLSRCVPAIRCVCCRDVKQPTKSKSAILAWQSNTHNEDDDDDDYDDHDDDVDDDDDHDDDDDDDDDGDDDDDNDNVMFMLLLLLLMMVIEWTMMIAIMMVVVVMMRWPAESAVFTISLCTGERREAAVTKMLTVVCVIYLATITPSVTQAFFRTLVPGYLPAG